MFFDISAALESLGVSTTLICMRHDNIDVEFVVRTFQSLQKFDGPKFIFDFNGKTNLHLPHQGRQVSLIKEFKIPRFVQLLDHPAVHENYLRMDQFKTAWGVVAPHHITAAKALSGDGPITFMPHGGPQAPFKSPPPPHARPIEMLFCGNIRGASTLADLSASSGFSDPAVFHSVQMAVDAHIDGNAVLSEALTENFKKLGLDLDRGRFAQVYSAIEGWVVAEGRRATLAALPKDSDLVVCGAVPPDLKLPGNSKVLGPIEFADFLDLAGNAQILLNSRTPFRDGAHERIFYGLSRGAAILTDGQDYLVGDQAHLPIGFYDNRPSSVAQAVSAIRARNAGRREIDLENESDYYTRRHSWATRMTAALDFMVSSRVIEI